jgi:hypothetical protein
MEPQIYVLWFDAASRANRQPGTKLPARLLAAAVSKMAEEPGVKLGNMGPRSPFSGRM